MMSCNINNGGVNLSTCICCIIKWISRSLSQVLREAVLLLVSLTEPPYLSLCLILAELPDFLLCKSFRYDVGMQDAVRIG